MATQKEPLLGYEVSPLTMGLLGAGATLMQQSGPSATPRSTAQIVGSGLLAGMSAYSKQDLANRQARMDAQKALQDQFEFQQKVQEAARRRQTRKSLERELPGMIQSMAALPGLTPADQQRLKTAQALGRAGAYDSAVKILESITPKGPELKVVNNQLVRVNPDGEATSIYDGRTPESDYYFANTEDGVLAVNRKNLKDHTFIGAPGGADSKNDLFGGTSIEGQMYNIKIRSQLPPSDPRYLSPSDPKVQAADDYFSAQRTRGSFVDTETKLLPDGSTKETKIRRFADGSSEVVGENIVSPSTTANQTKAVELLRSLKAFENSLIALEENLNKPEGTETFGPDAIYQETLYNDAATKLRKFQELGAPQAQDLVLMKQSLTNPTEFFSMNIFGPSRVKANIQALLEGIERDKATVDKIRRGDIKSLLEASPRSNSQKGAATDAQAKATLESINANLKKKGQ
jgi:hypothetical protein